jgi:hypothetical protein
MALFLPKFNVLMDWWFPGNSPAMAPPDIHNVPAQLYFNSRSFADTTPSTPDVWDPATYVRISISSVNVLTPPLVGGVFGYTDANGSVWYLKVTLWWHTHLGFPNEYASLMVEQCAANGASPDPGR